MNNVDINIILVFFITQLSLRMVTQIVKDKNLNTPLPDIYHGVLPISLREWHEYSDWFPALPLMLFIILDKFKNAVDFLMMVGILYLIRVISFSLTVLPPPDPNCKCDWEEKPKTLLRKVLNLIYQEGCADLIFSGHTSIMLMSTLFIIYYYFPNNLLVKFLLVLFNIFGCMVIIATRLHYSVDVFMATIITTLLFFHHFQIVCE